MARIVCQVLFRSERISFLWSEGAARFEPYHLEGAERARFLDLANQAQRALAAGDVAAAANLGRDLYRAFFGLDAAAAGPAAAVHAWFAALANGNQIDKLEILSDAPGLVPWNLLCEDGKPEQCWGVRFNLGAGRRVNALRANPVLIQPLPVLAADNGLLDGLSDAQRPLLDPLREAGRLFHSAGTLEDELKKRVPDIILLLARIGARGLVLGGESFTIADLQEWIAAASKGNPDPIVILMGCGEASGQAIWQTVLDDAATAFSGLVANEMPLSAGQAFGIGYAFAQRLMDGKGSVGEILRALRQEHLAAGQAFSAFCPPQVRVGGEGPPPHPQPLSPGQARGDEIEAAVHPLPRSPYRPFAAYDADSRALFFGREDDVIRGALLVDRADCAGIFLHGSPAVGKTSYLQAGLLPYLEEESVGYRALRDRSPLEQPVAEADYPILILRCTSDLAGQFADALTVFCAQPFVYTTPAGAEVTVDLPNLLHQAVTGSPRPILPASTAIQEGTETAAPPKDAEGMSPRELWIALREDKTALVRVIEAITRSLPFELVIAVDQGEELLTLVATVQQQVRRRKALEMLMEVAAAAPRCKIVFTLRSQYLAELESLLPGAQAPAGWRAFRLRPLSESEMVDALLWPTNREEIPYSEEVPQEKYHFRFEEGSAQQIVADAIEAANVGGHGPLPIVQAAGALLYDKQVVGKKQEVVRYGDLKDLGGVKKAFAAYFDLALGRLPFSKASRSALRALIGRLHTSHADGTISRDLVPADELKKSWRGGTEPVETVVNEAADRDGLFDIQQLFIGGESDTYVSLAQDSLARLSQSIDAERDLHAYGKTKIIDTLWIMIPLAFLCATLSYCVTSRYLIGAPQGEEDTKKIKEAAEFQARALFAERGRRPLYAGLLAQAEQALQAENALRARQILVSQPALRAYSEHTENFRVPELRGFEWRYLWRSVNGERHLFAGQRGPVNAVAVSSDGKWAASAGAASAEKDDGTIRVWDLASGKLLALMPGKREPVFALAFAPDNKTLASAGADKLVRLWDVSGLKSDFVEIDKDAKTLPGHADAVYALAFGKDAQTLASAGADKKVILWDIAAGKPRHAIEEHGGAIRAVVFLADDKTLASAGDDAQIVLWDLASGKKRQTVKTDYQAIAALAVSTDAKVLASAGIQVKTGIERGVIRFWDADSGKETHKPIEHGAAIRGIAFAPDSSGPIIASAGSDPVIRAFDVNTGKPVRRWLGHLGTVNAIAYARSGAILVSGSTDATARAWNAGHSTGPETIHAHDAWVQCLALNTKSTLLASGGSDGTVKLWDPQNARLVKELPKQAGAVAALAFSRHGDKTVLAVGSRGEKDEGVIKIFEIALDDKAGAIVKETQSLKDDLKAVACLAFSPNPDRADVLVSGSSDGAVKVWNVASGKCAETHRAHKGQVSGIVFSREGKIFVSAGRDALVCVFEIGKPDFDSLSGLSPAPIEAVALVSLPGAEDHPEDFDLHLLLGSADHTVRLYRLDRSQGAWKKGDELRFLRPHGQALSGILENNGFMATSSWDGTTKLFALFDPARMELLGQELLTLQGHQGAVRAIIMAGDQSFLVSAGNDGSLRFWRAYKGPI